MISPAKVHRFWRRSRPYRKRFGTLDGVRVANDLVDLTYRRIDQPYVPVRVPGWLTPLWMRPRTTDLDVFNQVIVGRELEIDLDPAPRRIIDGGANIGIASRVFAERWPAAEIVAVELEMGNFAALQKNVATIPAIRPRCGALWSNRGTVGIARGQYGELDFRVDPVSATGQAPAFPMEDLLDELRWDTVDLVKLDIEGAEREVFSTSSRWLDRVTHLVVELHDRVAPGCTEAFESALDRRKWRVYRHGEYHVASRIQ